MQACLGKLISQGKFSAAVEPTAATLNIPLLPAGFFIRKKNLLKAGQDR